MSSEWTVDTYKEHQAEMDNLREAARLELKEEQEKRNLDYRMGQREKAQQLAAQLEKSEAKQNEWRGTLNDFRQNVPTKAEVRKDFEVVEAKFAGQDAKLDGILRAIGELRESRSQARGATIGVKETVGYVFLAITITAALVTLALKLGGTA